MKPLWVLAAFVLGFIVNRVGLPPLVGYLIAGFVLNALGAEGGAAIENIADLGVMLLLFSIGLKLRLRSLAKPEVWFGASLHMLITVLLFGALFIGLGVTGIKAFHGLSATAAFLIAFSLSFSSTVFAVKVLEERSEMASLHGRVSIGILIMQDIFAVILLTFSTGKIPSPWAILVPPALVVLRPVITRVLDRVGHRELLLLFGVFMALGLGAGGFELVGLKPDLGALVMGVLLAGHPKADELAKVLLSFKDLFLVGFFLNIGLSGTPDLAAFGIAAALTVLVSVKVALYFGLLTRFRLRSRTSLLAAFSLANYSEFGLLVSSIGVKNGWLGAEWPIIIAIALSLSFILASPLNAKPHTIYARFADRLKRFQTEKRHPDDQPVDPGEAEIAVFGMGRVGTSAYDELRKRLGDKVLGLDMDPKVVQGHLAAGRKVIQNDATDPDFWENIRPSGRIRLVMLAMAEHAANIYAARRILESPYVGMVAATAKFEDDAAELEALGVHAVHNLYAEAGAGFAEHVLQKVKKV
jgi:glutathione-regulated potassium-efflux system ancillary protein KefC